MMKRTLPVSTYFSLSSGNTLLWKLAQWPQVIEAYSTTVMGASALPSTRSGSGPGFISSSTGTSVTRPLLRDGLVAAFGWLEEEDRNQADAAARARTPAPAKRTLRRLSGSDSFCETRFRSRLDDGFNGSVLAC